MINRWSDSQTVDERVESMLQRLMLENKIDLVSGKWVVDDSGQSPSVPEGFPELLLADGPAGLRIANPEINGGKATALPAPIALAATWDPELARQYGHLIGEEAAATGHNIFLGPAVDIARVPLGGRTFESFGEDPLLQARMVVPEIQAIQSHSVLACIKHYLANNQEFKRYIVDVQVDQRTLHEIYLPPFAAAVQQGNVACAMGSYNQINGTFACESETVLTKLLREELGFRGFVMSDFMANPSTIRSAQAGLDWELGTKMWGPRLMDAVQAGDLPIELLDEMVRRILRPILGLGLADLPRKHGLMNEKEHSSRARLIAEQAIVLLKNEHNLLPLVQDNIRSIAVIGPDADNLSAAGGGSAYVRPTLSVSVLDGIRQRAGNSIQIKYAPGTDALGPGALLPGPVAIPSSCFSEAGVTIEYWTNPTFSGDPFLTRIEPKVELNYGLVDLIQGSTTGSPKLPVKPSNMFGRFSARFTGSLIIPKAGEYQFSLSSLGTARLYFDDRLILDTVTATSEPPLGNSLASVYSVNIMLEIGTVQVRVEYANDYSEETRFHEAMLRLGWVPPVGVVPPVIQEAVELAKRSDLTIVVARTYETEETDRPSLSLPNGQDELIRAVSAVNSKTIVVLMNASPVDVASWEANVPAILESWYAGQEQGNAVARILFGDVNPSGRLPITFPRSIVETPVSTPIQYPGIDNKVQYSEGLFVGYRGYDKLRLEPQYPFGYGISYTTFEYSDLKLDKELINGDETLDVSFAITNTGQRAGVDVPQIYISLPESTAASVKRLVSWERILLQPGERKQIYIVLDPKSPEHPFSFYNADTRSWEIASGDYVIHLGASSQDIRIISPFKMQKTM